MKSTRSEAVVVRLSIVLWLIAMVLSLAFAANTEPSGTGFTRGMNRAGTFFRWQFLAFALAIFTWMRARSGAELSRALRVMARIPIATQCLLGLVGVIVIVLAVVLD